MEAGGREGVGRSGERGRKRGAPAEPCVVGRSSLPYFTCPSKACGDINAVMLSLFCGGISRDAVTGYLSSSSGPVIRREA